MYFSHHSCAIQTNSGKSQSSIPLKSWVLGHTHTLRKWLQMHMASDWEPLEVEKETANRRQAGIGLGGGEYCTNPWK